MIVETMTKQGLLREINDDVSTLLRRIKGWRKKYNKKMKDKRVPFGTLLDTLQIKTSKYNTLDLYLLKGKDDFIPFRAVYKVFMKDKYGNFGWHFIVPNIQNGGKVYDVDVYTPHFIKRLKERLDMTFDDYIRDMDYAGVEQTAYTYNIPEGQFAFNIGNKGLALVEGHKWGFLVKTVVNREKLYQNQVEILDDCYGRVVENRRRIA